MLLLAALSECHLLSFLHIAVVNGVVVTGYADAPQGWLEQEGIGGRFTRVVLRPRVQFAEPVDAATLARLHDEAGSACFIAASVNFPVEVEALPL